MPFTEYIKGVNEEYAKPGFVPHHWIKNLTAPLTPFAKKLSDCRVALLGGGGISLKTQEPYNKMSLNDLCCREIPGDAKPEDLVVSSAYIRHEDTNKDLNNLFPLELLREMAHDGYIGGVSPVHYIAGIGRLLEPNLTAYTEEVLPEIIGKLKDAKVDVVLCCGG